MSDKAINKAAEYVLGTLEGSERRDFEQTLESDAGLQTEVEFWENTLGVVGAPAPAIKPSDAVWQGILSGLESASPPGTLTIRSDEGDWKPLLPKVQRKNLLRDPHTGAKTFLLRLEPGAVLPPHDHEGTEECLVVEGEIIAGNARFHAGDFHVAPAGVSHPAIRSETGAILFLRVGRSTGHVTVS